MADAAGKAEHAQGVVGGCPPLGRRDGSTDPTPACVFSDPPTRWSSTWLLIFELVQLNSRNRVRKPTVLREPWLGGGCGCHRCVSVQDVDGCLDRSGCGVNRDGDALVSRSFEVVESLPVGRQVSRLEDLHIDLWGILVDDQGWVPQLRTPALLDEGASHLPVQPPALQPIQLVLIWASGRQGSVGHKAAVSIHRAILLGPLHEQQPAGYAIR